MQKNWYQTTRDTWQQWRQEKPLWIIWGGIALAFLLYYLIVNSTLNYIVGDLSDEINDDQAKAVWMAKASKEIVRLRQAAPHQKIKRNESAFTLVNQSINTAGWNNLVTDVHQVQQNRVQVTFNSIPYSDLVDWLTNLYNKDSIYVLEVTLERKQAGIVQANILLQQSS